MRPSARRDTHLFGGLGISWEDISKLRAARLIVGYIFSTTTVSVAAAAAAVTTTAITIMAMSESLAGCLTA